MIPTEKPDPIRHVVALILENHSFDQMLGCLKASTYPAIEGIDTSKPGRNIGVDGTVFIQAPTNERYILLDPHHEVDHVEVQLSDGNGGFIRDFDSAFAKVESPEQRQYIMSYFPMGFLPALHALAGEFAVCDRWHASLPGPTWPNRFFALAGTSCGKYDMPDDGEHKSDLAGYFEQDQDTIFDRLSEKAIHWCSFYSGIPQSIVFCHQRRPGNIPRYLPMEEFFEQARGGEASFPQFALIEPDFMGRGENDDHPPHDVMKAQKLIADVYNALRSNAELWNSTLLVIYYDEHGGFYDHVQPPPAVPPDQFTDYPFNRYGVRVPAVLVSPWVQKGLNSTLFDHTSVLKYLTDKWGLAPLGQRAATANNIGSLLGTGPIRGDCLPRIDLPPADLEPASQDLEDAAVRHENGHQAALRLMMDALEEEAIDKAAPLLFKIIAAIQRIFTAVLVILGLKDRSDVVKARFSAYHQAQREKAKPQLAAMVNNTSLDALKRWHAAQSLGYLVGVDFSKAADPVLAAKGWLDKNRLE